MPCAYGIPQRRWLFLGWGKPFISDAKGEANFSLGMQSHPLPTHLSEVRIHLRTCFRLVPCKHKNVPTLCVPPTGVSVWPLALFVDHKQLGHKMLHLILCPGTFCDIKHNHREFGEPSPPRLGVHHSLSHTGRLCYILYLPLLLCVEA